MTLFFSHAGTPLSLIRCRSVCSYDISIFLQCTRWVIRVDSIGGVVTMIVLDAAALMGLAALVTSLSALVWSIRRKAG